MAETATACDNYTCQLPGSALLVCCLALGQNSSDLWAASDSLVRWSGSDGCAYSVPSGCNYSCGASPCGNGRPK